MQVYSLTDAFLVLECFYFCYTLLTLYHVGTHVFFEEHVVTLAVRVNQLWHPNLFAL